jgi:endonuclease/exonuclease/phosphatase family metal-dependent hydrolase
MSRPGNRGIRIATYNVHACVGTDGRHDPRRIGDVIAEIDADVVALQEFSCPADVALETRSPVVLESLDGYACALGPTLVRRKNHFGNVLLSRHPIRELARIDLSVSRREPRGALSATIDLGGKDLHVVATHLGLRLGERRTQVERLLAHVESLRTAFFAVVGDFNDWLPGRSVAHALEERLGSPPKRRSFPGFWPVLALDRIWVQPAGALREIEVHASRLARRASDHLPVVAVLDPP